MRSGTSSDETLAGLSEVMTDARDDVEEQGLRDRLRSSLFDEPSPVVTIGRYQVLEKIGSGGLGIVYAAYDPELDRKVALKLVRRSRVGSDAAARMQREAQAMAKITHPNVVTVHDVGPHGDGVFIAMELVNGVTLSRWMKARERSWKAIRDVLLQAGEGLVAAHRGGVIHRDFKPSNVLVDDAGRPHVLDFGLARAAEDEREPAPSTPGAASTSMLDMELTHTGTMLGTPAYMAPEQFRGNADARTDQWAFCVTAYEAFYGERPFRAASSEALQAAIEAGHLPPPPPGPAPSFVYKAIVRGLSVDPAQRHPSMEALLDALQKDLRSRRLQWVSIAGVLILVAGTATVTRWVVQSEPTAAAHAEIEALEQQARAAAAAGRFLYPPAEEPEAPTAFRVISGLESLEGPIDAEAEARARALREEFAESLAALGDKYSAQDGGVPFASDFYAAALLFDPEHARAKERSPLTPGELAALRAKAAASTFTEAELLGAEPLAALAAPDPKTRNKKLARLYRGKRSPAASTSLQLERLLGEDAPAVFRGEEGKQTRTAAAKGVSAKPAEAGAGASSAAADPEPPAKKSDREAARVEAEQGRAAAAAGHYEEAKQAFHRALGHDRRNTVALGGLSNLYFDQGAYQKALEYARQAVAVKPKNAALRMQLGDTLFKVHRYMDAQSEYEAAKKLGHKGAETALAKLRERLGKP